MPIGIKTFARKVLNQFEKPSLLYKGISKHIFPGIPTAPFRVKARLYGLESELKQRNVTYNLGSLYTLPHFEAASVYKQFIKYNPGNLGDWSDNVSQTYATTELEYEVIHSMIDLYRGSHVGLRGYITSGATEGNIFSVWLGKQYLEQHFGKKMICLLKSSLTHYSVRKAGQLCSVPQFVVPLNTKWGMDGDGFKNLVQTLFRKGYRGFIIPLTLGYTSTGTSDDIESIVREADKLKKKLKNTEFFFWIDAAMSGLVSPFIRKDFRPFQSSYIKTFVVDFHKFGQVPYPAGTIIYRRELKRIIERKIDYLRETDATLLGSRSGIPAISIWTMIHTLGKTGYTDIVNEQKRNKKFFIEKIQAMLPETEVITHADSLSCGLVFKGLTHFRLPKNIEEKYNFFPGKTNVLFYPNTAKKIVLYKCYFLPHLKRRVLNEFFADLEDIV